VISPIGMFANQVIYLVTLVVGLFSTITSATVVILYLHYSTKKNTSRLLQIIISLIFADGSVGCCLLVWDAMSRLLSKDALHRACCVMLPIPIMFFLVGYGCTVLVCLRFLQVSRVSSSSGQQKSEDSSLMHPSPLYTPPLWTVWAVSFAITLPITLMNNIGHDYGVARVVTTATDITYCMFDPTTWLARGTNFICFQVPLFLTIIINVGAFVKGMKALQNSPHSVIAREMKRVGQYLFVLLIVWVPNLVINLIQWFSVQNHEMAFRRADEDDDEELDSTGYTGTVVSVMILLTTLQGLLNATAYALSHRAFRQYLSFALCPHAWDDLARRGCGCSLFLCCCASLVEEDHFASASEEPLLRSFDEDGEPVTQNGYKCKVTYTFEDDKGNLEHSEDDDEREYGVTYFRDVPKWNSPRPHDSTSSETASQSVEGSQRSQSSHSSHSSQSLNPPMAYPFSPTSSIDQSYNRSSKDSLTDIQRLSSNSNCSSHGDRDDIRDSDINRNSKSVNGGSGEYDSDITSWPRSAAVPIPKAPNEDMRTPSGSVLVGSLRSSLKGGVVSPLHSKGSPSALSDSEKMVRFDV